MGVIDGSTRTPRSLRSGASSTRRSKPSGTSVASRSGAGAGSSSVLQPLRAGSDLADYVASVAARKLPIVGRGDNYVSHLHVADTATAITAALTAPAGVYNVSDDHPVTKRAELESLAASI